MGLYLLSLSGLVIFKRHVNKRIMPDPRVQKPAQEHAGSYKTNAAPKALNPQKPKHTLCVAFAVRTPLLWCSLCRFSFVSHFSHSLTVKTNHIYSARFARWICVFSHRNAGGLQEQLNRLEAVSGGCPSHQRRRLPGRRGSRGRLARDLARLSRLRRLALSAGNASSTFVFIFPLWLISYASDW